MVYTTRFYGNLIIECLYNYKIYMNWSEAYKEIKKANIWGFIDLSENFTQDTLAKQVFC